MQYKKLTLMLLILFACDASGYGFEYEECRNEKYLICIKSNKQECVDANTKAKELCYEIFPIELIVDEDKDLDVAKKFGECIANEYLKQLNISSDDYEQCWVHLRELYDEKIKKAREKKKSYDEEFHKYD